MKKIPFLSFILVFMISSSVQAFEWAYSFVVWDGKEYEVKQAELIDESEIEKRIGEVKTEPYYYSDKTDAMTYSGDASNVYPIGTPYYEIRGVSTSTAIAVKVDNKWVRADYVREAPQHIMDTITKTKTFNIAPVVIIGLNLIVLIFLAIKKSKRRNEFN